MYAIINKCQLINVKCINMYNECVINTIFHLSLIRITFFPLDYSNTP